MPVAGRRPAPRVPLTEIEEVGPWLHASHRRSPAPVSIICNGEWIPFKESTLEHIIPRVLGGKDNPENLILACDPCNQETSKLYNEVNHENQ